MNWHTAYVDGEPSRFRTTDEGAAALPDGHMTRLQFGEWASRWPCDGMFAAVCVHEWRRHEAERRRREHGCCGDGPDEHGLCRGVRPGKCELFERVKRLIAEENANWRSEDEYARAIEHAAND